MKTSSQQKKVSAKALRQQQAWASHGQKEGQVAGAKKPGEGGRKCSQAVGGARRDPSEGRLASCGLASPSVRKPQNPWVS